MVYDELLCTQEQEVIFTDPQGQPMARPALNEGLLCYVLIFEK